MENDTAMRYRFSLIERVFGYPFSVSVREKGQVEYALAYVLTEFGTLRYLAVAVRRDK